MVTEQIGHKLATGSIKVIQLRVIIFTMVQATPAPSIDAPKGWPVGTLKANGMGLNGNHYYLAIDSNISLVVRGNGHQFYKNTALIAAPSVEYVQVAIEAYKTLVIIKQLKETYHSPKANGGWFHTGMILGFFSDNSKGEIIKKLNDRVNNYGGFELTLKHHRFIN